MKSICTDRCDIDCTAHERDALIIRLDGKWCVVAAHTIKDSLWAVWFQVFASFDDLEAATQFFKENGNDR